MKKAQTIFYLDLHFEGIDNFRDITQNLGYTFLRFNNGQNMLFELHVMEKKPNIIFLDINMPIINGKEILYVLKESDSLKNIPVAMVSDAYPKKLVTHLQGLGVQYMVRKNHVNDFNQALMLV